MQVRLKTYRGPESSNKQGIQNNNFLLTDNRNSQRKC